MSVTCKYSYVCCEMFFFFDIFRNHFPKIHINVFREITRDVLYFWNAYDVNLWKNISGEVEPTHAEQMFFYNFISLRGKKTPAQLFFCRTCETFKNNGGCIWKQVTYYYVIKNYVVSSSVLSIYSIVFIANPMMRYETSMMWCDFERNEQPAETCVWNKKKYFTCCIILIRNDTILSQNI